MGIKSVTFWGNVSNGKLSLNSPEKFKKYVSGINGIVSLTVKKRRKIRTTPQNSLYWLWVTEIANYCGYEPEEMHDTFKTMFNSEIKTIPNKSSGEIKEIKVTRSTTVLNIVEFIEYMERIERYAAELGITLPQPEDYYNNNNS
jgi:hypothetical protein